MLTKETIGIWDVDGVIYAAGFVGEERSIVVKHIPTGKQKKFSTRTEFWGGWQKKDGGWLGDINKARVERGRERFLPDEFEIEDHQEVKEDLANVFHTTKMMIHGALVDIKADSHVCYIGKSKELIRHKESTLLEYKGNRKEALRPLLKDDIIEYIVKHQNGILVTDGLEADDHVLIRAIEETKRGNKAVVISPDKDAKGTPCLFFNPDKPEQGIQNGDQFGKLWLDDKGKVDGIGRMWLYHQVCSNDKADNYAANCFSDTKWADKSSYEALKDVASDKDAWKAMWDVYKTLYPEPKVITGWRGDAFTIDALYVLNEVFNLAHMWRNTKNDRVDVQKVLNKYGIIKGRGL